MENYDSEHYDTDSDHEEMALDGVGQSNVKSQHSMRSRIVEALFKVLSSNIVFWMAGFVDGMIVMYLMKFFKG